MPETVISLHDRSGCRSLTGRNKPATSTPKPATSTPKPPASAPKPTPSADLKQFRAKVSELEADLRAMMARNPLWESHLVTRLESLRAEIASVAGDCARLTAEAEQATTERLAFERHVAEQFGLSEEDLAKYGGE